MAFLEDVARTVTAARTALASVSGVAEAVEGLRPLADRALRGDRSAEAELARLVSDPTVAPVTNAAARILVEYVALRKKAGALATTAGVGLYPGQVVPLVLLGVGLLGLLLWRRR